MPRPTCLSGTVAAALIVVGAIGCSPTAPAIPPSAPPPPPPVSNNLLITGITPVAGKPAEHTDVRILGTGFQSGLIVTFDGSPTPATFESRFVIVATAPPHAIGAIDIVIINPDGGTSRVEKAFTYVDDLSSGGDFMIGPGESLTAILGNDVRGGCTDDGVPCRRLFIRAPADEMVQVELMPLDTRERIGLYENAEGYRSQAPTHFPKQLTVRGGEQVWVMGEYALFRLTARNAK